jgi:multicomponent Na+:H+ antiporter subunit F
MNPFLIAVVLLQAGLLICGIICVYARLLNAIVAMEMASAIAILSVALLAEAVGRPAWFDLALALALLSFPSGLVFLVFIEKWQ